MDKTETHRFTPTDLTPEFWQMQWRPKEIFALGKSSALPLLQKLPHRGLAIVGTRVPQSRSLSLVEESLRALSGTDLVVISGLAIGVDTAAHEAALKFRIPTVAVLAHGVDRCYPKENEKLRDQIIEAGGLILSERPLGSSPTPKSFLYRNRLIATWSQATWVVEASYRSGALNTARWARDVYRPTYVVPCYPGDLALAGNQKLLDEMDATPYWGPQTLGLTWPELAERGLGHQICKPQGWFDDDASQITMAVRNLSISQGGVAIPALMEWSLAQGWMPQRFYTALQAALRKNTLADRHGMVVSTRIFNE